MTRSVPRRAAGLAVLVLAAALSAVTTPSPAGAATLTLAPEADATVAKASPALNQGQTTSLGVDNSPVLESYLRFSVTGLTQAVTAAAVRLFVTNGSSKGPALFSTTNVWTETGITWANKPARTGPAVAGAGKLAAGAYVEFDVTKLVTGNGTYSFDLAGTSTDGAAFASREASANRPQLLVTTGSQPQPPPPPPAGTQPFAPVADARVEQAQPDTNFGTATNVGADGQPVVESFVRFDVAGLTGPAQKTMLRLFVTNPTVDSPVLYPAANAWAETGITWSNRPARLGPATGGRKKITAGAYVEYDVTALVPGPGTYTFDLATASADGAYFWSREAAANQPQLVVTVGSPPPDTTPPDTTIDSAGVSGTTASFAFSSSEPGSTFECRLDAAGGSAPFLACTSPKSYSGLSEGQHGLEVRAIDGAGNVDPTPALATIAVADTTPPDTIIDSAGVSGTTATFTFSSTEANSTFECARDGAAFAACTSPLSSTGLAPGDHTFEVRATDAAHNTDPTPASRSVTVDPPPPPSIRDALLAPLSGAWFGVHAQAADFSQAGNQAAVGEIEAALGRKVAIDHYYEPWPNVFPGWREQWDFDNGRIPMISWGKYYADQIAAGTQDAYIAARADGIKALGRPVFIRWFWEMDGTRNAAYAQSPANFIAAWQHIHDLFVARGATNVAWVWCPNASAFKTGNAQTYYPGDNYVDWICADGYNFYPDSAYRYVDEIYKSFYAWGAQRPKPLMMGEWGAQPTLPGERAGWLDRARRTLENDYPRILAEVYFHSYKVHDWRILPEADTLDVWRQMGQDAWFNP